MDTTATVAIIMGSVALIIVTIFIVGIVIIYKRVKKHYESDENVKKMVKTATDQALKEFNNRRKQ